MFSSTRLCIAVSIALALTTGALYSPVASHDFIGFDDQVLLVENTNLRAGLNREGLRWAATSTRDGNWMPLTWISFLLDVELAGLRPNPDTDAEPVGLEASGLAPGATHVTNVVLHIAGALLLFLAFVQMTRSVWPSAFVAGVFALHPLHVESVAWAIERKDVLSGFFFALTLLLYGRYAAAPGGARYAAVLVSLVAGLLSKAMLVTLPFVLLLLDLWPLQRLRDRPSIGKAVREKVPMLALVAAHSAITFWAQSSRGATEGLALTAADRLANAAWSLVAYLGMALWPARLAPFYPHPGDSLSLTAVLCAFALLVALTSVAVAAVRRAPELLVGWLWYVGMLVPVLGLVQVGVQAMADRYMYLPLIGLSVALAFSVARVCDASPLRSRIAAAMGLAVLIALASTSRAQLVYWQDGLTLFQHTVSVTRENAPALNALSVELIERGRSADALPHLRRAVTLDPTFSDAQVNLGAALLEQGQPAEALPHLERGLRQRDGLREGFVHASLGEARRQLGDPVAALPDLRRSVELEPSVSAYRANLGTALVEAGRLREGRTALTQAEAQGGERAEIHMALARAHQAEGQLAEAVGRYRQALDMRPDWLEPANNLGWILATSSDPKLRAPEEAVGWAKLAVSRAPNDPAVLDTLFAAYTSAGQWAEATDVGTRALELARRNGQRELAADIAARLTALQTTP